MPALSNKLSNKLSNVRHKRRRNVLNASNNSVARLNRPKRRSATSNELLKSKPKRPLSGLSRTSSVLLNSKLASVPSRINSVLRSRLKRPSRNNNGPPSNRLSGHNANSNAPRLRPVVLTAAIPALLLAAATLVVDAVATRIKTRTRSKP